MFCAGLLAQSLALLSTFIFEDQTATRVVMDTSWLQVYGTDVIAAPLFEEVIFRGYVQGLLMMVHPALGVVSAALIFGLSHWELGTATVLTTTLWGWGAGILYLRHRSLPLLICAHALYNGGLVSLLYLFQLHPGARVPLGLLLALGTCCYLIRHRALVVEFIGQEVRILQDLVPLSPPGLLASVGFLLVMWTARQHGYRPVYLAEFSTTLFLYLCAAGLACLALRHALRDYPQG